MAKLVLQRALREYLTTLDRQWKAPSPRFSSGMSHVTVKNTVGLDQQVSQNVIIKIRRGLPFNVARGSAVVVFALLILVSCGLRSVGL